MNEPWFNPGYAGAILGSTVGCYGALFGCSAGYLVPKGKGKSFVWSLFWFAVVCAFGLLIAGTYAAIIGQPYSDYYPLLLCGFILLFVMGPQAIGLKKAYRSAEERKMHAQDMQADS